MRKSLIGLVLVLSLSSLPAFSANTPKAGSACNKNGATKTYKGKEFKCVKKRGKLVWSKGKVVNKETSVAAPEVTPSVAPTPRSTPTPMSTSKPSPTSAPVPTIASTPAPTPASTPTPTLAPLYVSPDELSVCRIPQLSQNPNIPFFSYPIKSDSIYAMLPRIGPINVAVIPIDFSDAIGTSPPNSFMDMEYQRVNEWMSWYSHGKSYYVWQKYDNWIRAPRPSYDYVPYDTPGPTQGNSINGSKVGRSINQFEAASELLDVAEEYYDFKNMNVVLFVFPPSNKNIYDPWTRNGNFQGTGHPGKGTYKDLGIRDKRLVNVQIDSIGAIFHDQSQPIWSWFLHENLHNQGLLGHAPNQGSGLGIMTSQWGIRLPLQSWDSITLDWQLPSDIYCVKRESIQKTEIVMSPLEREEIGTKAIMIRLSEYEILVIESRRDDKWINPIRSLAGRSPELNGLVVYKVDVSQVTPYGVIEPDGKDWRDSSTSFAYYIRNSIPNRGYSTIPGGTPFDLNFMIYPGETLSYRGVKITLASSGIHDNVIIDID